MEIPDQLRCLFSARLEEREDSYVIQIPEQELRLDNIQDGTTYRVALLDAPSTPESDDTESVSKAEHEQEPQTPLVEEGEQRTVEIKDIGEQGDGITRVNRGFVVIVPDTEQGERVIIEIRDVRQNVAFAEVIKRVSYYD